MTINTFVTIIFIIITLVIMGTGAYFYFRDKTLNEIRAEVYQKFLEAEHNKDLVTGKRKMRWVLSQVRNLLPAWLQNILTDEYLEKIVEGWFKAIKDLLDDGKLNGSHKKTKEE